MASSKDFVEHMYGQIAEMDVIECAEPDLENPKKRK